MQREHIHFVTGRLAELRGLPQSITVDHGPEFEGRVLDAWAYAQALERMTATPVPAGSIKKVSRVVPK